MPLITKTAAQSIDDSESIAWRVSYVQPGAIDPETREEIAPGWRVICIDPEEADVTYAEVLVLFAVDTAGRDITEQVARYLCDMFAARGLHKLVGITEVTA